MDLKRELSDKKEKISILESTQRKMLGEDLESCSMKELNQLESQADRGLKHIRARLVVINRMALTLILACVIFVPGWIDFII